MLCVLADRPAVGQESLSSGGDERLTATDVDPNSFGFSIPELASSLGVKIRGLLGSRSGVEKVRNIINPAYLQYNYYRAALNVLSTWTANSEFSGLVRVNQPPKPGFINFFILEHDYLARKEPSLSCGCSYVPGSWSIVCDGLFLSSAQRLLDSEVPDKQQPAGETKAQSPRWSAA